MPSRLANESLVGHEKHNERNMKTRQTDVFSDPTETGLAQQLNCSTTALHRAVKMRRAKESRPHAQLAFQTLYT